MVETTLFSRRACGLPSVFDERCPEEALSAVLKELKTQCVAHTPCTVVVDFSENNLTLEHVKYLTDWLSEENVYLYALDLSLNRIYGADWMEILPSIKKALLHVQRLHLGGNPLPALQKSPALEDLQHQKVAFLAPKHSLSGNDWVQAWNTNARDFNRLA